MLQAPEEVIREVLALEEAKRRLDVRAIARDNFLAFVNEHHHLQQILY